MCQAQPLKYQISLLLKRYVQYLLGKIQSQVEPQFYLSPLNWGLETKGILNQPSLNTGLLEGFYLQLSLSPLIR